MDKANLVKFHLISKQDLIEKWEIIQIPIKVSSCWFKNAAKNSGGQKIHIFTQMMTIKRPKGNL